MNTYTLQFKSQEFEEAFTENQQKDQVQLLRIGTFSHLLQSIALLIALLLKQNGAKIGDISVIAAYFTLSILSIILRYLNKNISLSNYLFFLKNVISCILISACELYGNSQTEYNNTHPITYEPLLGALLTIEVFCGPQSTNFIFRSISYCLNMIIYTIGFKGDDTGGIIVAIFLGTAYSIVNSYTDERLKRRLFMDKQRSTELQFLIDKLLPINVIVTKYNYKEERTFLHEVNRKAQNSFNIVDNDSFKEFTKHIIINPGNQNEISQEIDNENGQSQEKVKSNGNNHKEKTLFYYMETIAKQNFQGKSYNLPIKNNDQDTPINKFKGRRYQKRGSITKLHKIKLNDIESSNVQTQKQLKKTEFEMRKINSIDSGVQGSSISLSPLKNRAQQKQVNLGENNSINLLQNSFNPMFNIVNNSINSSCQINMENNSKSKNNSIENSDKERNVRFSFDPDNNLVRQTPFNSQTNKSDFLSLNKCSNLNKSQTLYQNSTTVQGSNHNANNKMVNQKNILHSQTISEGKEKRGQKKNDVLRKVSNFNLRAGIANTKVKYCEDVYDRIDVLSGVYKEQNGNQDETLAGQVKYLKELNKFLYLQFQSSLEQFRVPLAFSLLKLNKLYELQKQPLVDNLSQSMRFLEQQNKNSDNPLHSAPNLSHFNPSAIPTLITNNLNSTPVAFTTPANACSATTHTNSSSLTNLNIVSQSVMKQSIFLNQNEAMQYSSISPLQNGKLLGGFTFQKSISNSFGQNQFQKEDGNSSNHSTVFDNPQSPMMKEKQNSKTLTFMSDSLDNTRYYGFQTLNSIYNHIDYLDIIQNKDIQIKVTEISLRKSISDVVGIIEGVAKKKQVKMILLNDMKCDKIRTDDRRVKQVLLHLLQRILFKTHKGYIAIKMKSISGQYDSIKLSILSSSKEAYEIHQKLRLHLNSMSDIYSMKQAVHNPFSLDHSISTFIIGKLGPFYKIDVQQTTQGTIVMFQIFQDMNILQCKSSSSETDPITSQIHCQQYAAFKALNNLLREGDISEQSSCDLNYQINKAIVENNKSVPENNNGKYFFPQGGQNNTIFDQEDISCQLSSKIQSISPSKSPIQKQEICIATFRSQGESGKPYLKEELIGKLSNNALSENIDLLFPTQLVSNQPEYVYSPENNNNTIISKQIQLKAFPSIEQSQDNLENQNSNSKNLKKSTLKK